MYAVYFKRCVSDIGLCFALVWACAMKFSWLATVAKACFLFIATNLVC